MLRLFHPNIAVLYSDCFMFVYLIYLHIVFVLWPVSTHMLVPLYNRSMGGSTVGACSVVERVTAHTTHTH